MKFHYHRLGKVDVDLKRSSQFSAKFRNVITVDKLQLCASMLKTYETHYLGKRCAVFISKLLDKFEQEKEQRLLKNRQELLDQGNDPKIVKIRKSLCT